MTSAEDLTGKIVICTESIQGFKDEFPSLLQDLHNGPSSHAQVFFHLLSAILTSEDEQPINKFYSLYLILKVCESDPTQDFLLELAAQEKLVYEIFKAAQTDASSAVPPVDKGRTYFSPTPDIKEGNTGVNYVRLCIESIIYWADAFGNSDIAHPFYRFLATKETLAQKIALPSYYWFIEKDYYGNEEVAEWNFYKEDLPSMPSQSRARYQEGKGLVQHLKEGESEIQVIVSPNLNRLSPEKNSMTKSGSSAMTQAGLAAERRRMQTAVEDTPNFQDNVKPVPHGVQNFERVAQSVSSPSKENPLDKFRRKDEYESPAKKVSFNNDTVTRTGTTPEKMQANLEQTKQSAVPQREKIDTKFVPKKATLGMKMAEMGLFTDDKKLPLNTGNRTPGGFNKQTTPSSKDLDETGKAIRNFFVEREKAEIMSKRNSARMMQIPETEFRGQPLIESPMNEEPRQSKGASPSRNIRAQPEKLETFQDTVSPKESPLLLMEESISNENAYLRSQLQQRQKELEQSLQSAGISKENNLLNAEMDKYRDASQLQPNRYDSLVKENTFLKSKMFEFEQKLKEMNNKIAHLYNENKRLQGLEGDSQNPTVRGITTPSPKNTYFDRNMRASHEVFKQDSKSFIDQPRASENLRHNLRSTPDQVVTRSLENVGAQAGKKKIFELVNYEKPRMILTAKDFTQ